MQELGAGLQIGPNASRLLAGLGLGGALESISERYPAGELYEGIGGRKLSDLPMDQHAYHAYGAHSYQLMRADLLQILWRGLKTALGRDPVQLGAEVSGLSSDGKVVSFSDGRQEEADLVVGADGVESRVRALLFDDAPAIYSGYYAWRGLIDVEKTQSEVRLDTLSVWMGESRHLIAYPLNKGRVINLVGVSEQQTWPHSRSVETVPASEWIDDCLGWSGQPIALISGLKSCRKWSLRLISPLQSWSRGSAGLLGDAAHPMLPSLAQGAAQAMEDALVLTKFVADGAYSGEELLQHYFVARCDRVTRVQQASLWNLKYFHRPRTLRSRVQNLGMRFGKGMTPKIIARRYRWLYER